MNCLIDVDSLHATLRDEKPLVILDCRARLGDINAGRTLWEEGHIPGSRHFDLDRDMAATPGEEGRHPLPLQAEFTASLQRAGITPSVPVVVYDDQGGQLAAARAWWMLACWAGHPDVRVLDGGVGAWLRAGGAINTAQPAVVVSAWQPAYETQAVVDADAVSSLPALKLDARSLERFRGENEPIDPVAGHVPGALCRPSAENLTEQGVFKSAQQLNAELPTAEQVISYCGSGVTACHNILAYAVAGRPLPKLYAGSWSHWIRNPARPIAIDD